MDKNIAIVDGYASEHIESLKLLISEYIATWYSVGEVWNEKDMKLVSELGILQDELNHAGLLALVNEVPAGCVLIMPHDETSLEVLKLYVRLEFREHGVGRKLMQNASQRVTGAGKGIWGKVEATRAPAISLYKSMGLITGDTEIIDGFIESDKP